MALSLSNIAPAKGSKKTKTRIGRGHGSGMGTYSTRGQKGQRARAGGSNGLLRRGLKQLLRNKPKLGGFRSLQPKLIPVNVMSLEKIFDAGEVIDIKKLVDRQIIQAARPGVKILGSGNLTKKFTIIADAFSETAKTAILKAGGEAKIRQLPKAKPSKRSTRK